MRKTAVSFVTVALALLTRPGFADPPAPINTLDLTALANKTAATVAERRTDYDVLAAASCLQGLVNRSGPNFYLYYATSRFDTSINVDHLWLDRLTQDADVGKGLIAGRPVVPLTDIMTAIKQYLPLVKGLVVWDENVPATINAAFAAAGVEDLLVVRWDASPTSLFAQLQALQVPVKVWLVNKDGSSLFKDDAGTADVPGTTRASSQCAKVDVYRWIEETYQKPKRLDPTEFGYMLDATWVKDLTYTQPMNFLDLPSRDLIVAKRGFPFDLSPWTDVAATDAPHQTPGLDATTEQEILASARAQASPFEAILIRGFVPWQVKYSSAAGLPKKYAPVPAEWQSVHLVAPYAAGIDAGGGMVNGSFYRFVPVSETPVPQARPTPEDLVGNGFLTGLASNGGFEDGTADWTVQTTHYAVYTDTAATGARAHSGLRYLECNTTGKGDDSLYRDGPGVGQGKTVTLRAFVRAPGAPVQGVLSVWGLGGTTESKATPFLAKSDWSEVRTTIQIANAGHTTTRGQIYVHDSNTNLDIDDVAFYEGDAAAGKVEPANYLLWYVGDYDASSWMYAYSPNTWDSPGRGIVPFAWGFSGDGANRFPIFYNYVLKTRTARDFFVTADSGVAYSNPGAMEAPARATWQAAGMRTARLLDTSSGWLLDGLDPIDGAHLAAVAPFYGDGVLLLSNGGLTAGALADNIPIALLPGLRLPAETAVLNATMANPTVPSFHAYRTTQGSFLSVDKGTDVHDNVDLVNVSSNLVSGHGSGRYRTVDPFTFFELSRKQAGGANTNRASYLDVTIAPPVIGKPVSVTITVRNDGWETWSNRGASACRVGFDVADAPQNVRSLPSDSTAYPVRIDFPSDVPPGGKARVSATLAAIPDGKPRTLQVDVIKEGLGWFETAGDVPMQVTLTATVTAPALDAGADGGGGNTDAGELDASAMDADVDDAKNDGRESTRPDGGDHSNRNGAGGCGCRVGSEVEGPRCAALVVLFGFIAMQRRRARSKHNRSEWRRLHLRP